MALRIDNEEIWKWYEIIEKQRESGLSQVKFCKNNNISFNSFHMRYNKIVYMRLSNPELYSKLLELTRKFQSSNMSISEFVKSHDISPTHLSQMKTHLNYLNAIEKIKEEKEKENAPMKFIAVPKLPFGKGNPIIKPEEADIIEKQNDLEINISKGVKVIISPNIDSMKIIKIIELLKDL